MQEDNIKDIYSLTPQQEGFFFHSISDRESGAYFIQASYRMVGKIDPGSMEQALGMLTDRYDILRTSFVFEGLKRIFQVVLKKRPATFIYEDISSINDQEAYLEDYRRRDRERSFDLTHDPLMRVTLIKLAEESFELVWSHHHILIDGWCAGILKNEFGQLYEGLVSGNMPQLPPVVQYKDFIRWMEKQDRDEAEVYWTKYLQGCDTKASLSAELSNNISGYKNSEVMLVIEPAVTRSLQALCTRYRVTLNSVLQACWAMLLARYSSESNVVFGTVVSIRPPEVKGIETMVGLFINALPVRVQVNEEESFSVLLKKIQEAALKSEPYQYYPLADIQAATSLKQNLVDHVFVLDSHPLVEKLEGFRGASNEEANLKIGGVSSYAQVNYDFSVNISAGDSIQIRFNYNEYKYSTPFVEKIAAHFLSLVKEANSNPELKVADFVMLSNEEQAALLNAGAGPQRNYPGTIDSLFRQRVQKHPGAVALVHGNRQLTYAELDAQSSALAAELVKTGVKPGGCVAVKTGRGADAVISLLGVAKAGAACIPIEVSHPNERVASMLAGVRLDAVITTSDFLFDMPDLNAPIFAIDLQLDSQPAGKNIPAGSTDSSTAYIIFTSGTTGRPKGVPIMHKSIVDRAQYHIEYLGIGTADTIVQFASCAFDASIIEMMMALLSGARLVIPGEHVKQDVDAMEQFLLDNNVTVAILPPAYLKLMRSSNLSTLKHIISTGEAAVLDDMIYHAATKKVYNGYGPTETCIGATFHTVDPQRAAYYQAVNRIPVGNAFSNTAVYVLDERMRLVPKGVAGEMYIAGIGLSNGYISDDKLTAEKFTPNPFTSDPAFSRLYATGDMVQWNDEGELIYLGRKDGQVQIRGIRVETSEIENVLLRCEGVQQACVLPFVQEGNTYLAAYIVGSSDVVNDGLYAWLRSQLPVYMVPVRVTAMDAFPLTTSGKLDRSQFPAPDLSSDNQYEAPVGELETQLCDIWANVLGLDQVGRNDNFFEIGGHSLKATQIVSLLYRQTAIRIDIGELFTNPRVSQLAAAIAGRSKAANDAIPPAPEAADYPVTPSQRRLWVMGQLGGAGTANNISSAFRISGKVNTAALEAAFDKIVERHESLRTRFVLKNEGIRQVIDPWVKGSFSLIQYEAAEGAALDEAVNRELAFQFDLGAGNLFRVVLINSNVLVCTMHHIISDGISVQNMMQEMDMLYSASVNNVTASLPEVPVQYRDYAVWLEQELNGEKYTAMRSYWHGKLKGVIEPLMITPDFSRPAVQTFAGEVEQFAIEAETLQQLRNSAAAQGMSLSMMLTAAVKMLLHQHSGQENISIGSVVSGRQHPGVEKTTGCFINTVILNSQIVTSMPVAALLQQVKETLVDAYANQAYPFDQLVDELEVERDLSRAAVVDVIVNHQAFGTETEEAGLSGLEFGKYGGSSNANARYDMEIEFYEHTDRLGVRIVYNKALFTRATAGFFCSRLESLITGFADTESLALETGAYIAQSQRFTQEQLVALGTGAVKDYPIYDGYVSLFHKQVQQHGDAIAVSDSGCNYSYTQLAARASKVAAAVSGYISSVNGKPPAVAVSMSRGAAYIAVVIGIWQAGGIYMSLDPSLPPDRMKYMLDDSGCSLVITDAVNEALEAEQLIAAAIIAGPGPENTVSSAPVHQGSYLLYTSGSTGLPKGVIVPGPGMINHMYSKISDLGLSARSKIAQSTSQSFDVSIWQMFALLLCGGHIRVYNREEVLDLTGFARSLDRDNINVAQVVPSYLNELLEVCEGMPELRFMSLSSMLTTGEVLTGKTAARFLHRVPNARIFNCYGPTEASDNISIYSTTSCDAASKVPIGRTIHNMQLYVVDKAGRLCAPGIMGEIWVSGPGVAGRYHNNEERTKEAFMDDPFREGRKLYRTGDLGRWNTENGLLEFHGRADRQIKLRGQRIELDEIEKVMQQCTLVKTCAVVCFTDGHGGSLAGYVVWESQTEGQEMSEEMKQEFLGVLNAHLNRHLPAYMVPRQVVTMDKMPVTASGKLDRKRLPRITEKRESGTAPSTPTEIALAAIWAELLGKTDLSIEDNFFDAGGNSLKGMRLVAMIEKEFGINFGLRDFFQNPTLGELAKFISTVVWVQQAGSGGSTPAEEEEAVTF